MSTYNAFYVRKESTDLATRPAVLALYPHARIQAAAGFIGALLSRDDVEPPEQKLAELSRRLDTDVIWVTFQTTVESFIFQHWRAGSQLRALWYGCAHEGTWDRVEGEPEAWERDAFWDEESLESLLDCAETENEKQKLRSLWKDKVLHKGETAPVVSAEDAVNAVMEHYGLFVISETTSSQPSATPAEKVAADIKKANEKIYSPRHEYGPVDAGAFRHLDLKFYDRTRDMLLAQECSFLGDVENVTLKGTANDFRTFIRMLVSQEGTTSIGLFHPKPKIWFRLLMWILRVKMGRIIDCETELSGGRYLTTSNASEAGKLNPPPGFDMKFFPSDTDPSTVFRDHCQRLKDFLAANPAVVPTVLRTSKEVLEMQDRMQAIKSAFRKGIGYVTEDELARLGANPQAAADIKRAMDRSENAG